MTNTFLGSLQINSALQFVDDDTVSLSGSTADGGGGAGGGGFHVAGNLVPTLANTFSLGNATHVWKDTHIDTETLHVGNVSVRAQGNGALVVEGNLAVPGNMTVSEGLAMSSTPTTGNVDQASFAGGMYIPGYHAHLTMSCRGFVEFTSTNFLKWDTIIVFPVDRSYASEGYLTITCPTSGSIPFYTITHVFGNGLLLEETLTETGSISFTSDGIGIGPMSFTLDGLGAALWYRMTPDLGRATVSGSATEFIMTRSRNISWKPGSDWLLLATFNNATSLSGSMHFRPGNIRLLPGTQYNAGRSTYLADEKSTCRIVPHCVLAGKLGGGTTAIGVDISFTSVIYNVGNCWSTMTNQFTVKRTGYYFLSCNVLTPNNSSDINVQWYKNGVKIPGSGTYSGNIGLGYKPGNSMTVVYCTAGQSITLRPIYNTATFHSEGGTANHNYVFICQIA